MPITSDLPENVPNSRSYHKGNVTEDLRKAAERILATERLEDVTIRRLTREVGVTPANFYNHFISLDELLFDIGAKAFDEEIDRAAAIWSQGGQKADLLAASATAFIQFCMRNRELTRLMLCRDGRNQHAGLRAASSRAFATIVRFIYGEAPETGVPQGEQYGMAVGYIALTYGLAVVLTEGRFDLDIGNEAELSLFVRNSMMPFLDGTAAAAL